MNNKITNKISSNTEWLNKFVRYFSLQKFKKTLSIEGLSILKIYYKSGKFKNNAKLCKFMEDGWFEHFRLTSDKKVYLLRFEKMYNKKTYISPKRASIDLKLKNNSKHRPSSAPLIQNDTLSIENNFDNLRGIRPSSCVVPNQEVSIKYRI